MRKIFTSNLLLILGLSRNSLGLGPYSWKFTVNELTLSNATCRENSDIMRLNFSATMEVTDNLLTINAINHNRGGKYQCFVYNLYGETSNVCEVTVVGNRFLFSSFLIFSVVCSLYERPENSDLVLTIDNKPLFSDVFGGFKNGKLS